MTISPIQLTRSLSQALGLPKNTRKAVLTLEAGKPPTLELEVFVTDENGALVMEEPVDGAPVSVRLSQVKFRLEPMP